MIIDSFNHWFKNVDQDVEHVDGLLRQKLSDQPEELIRDLEEIEAWGSRIGLFLAEANSFLDKAQHELLTEKQPKETDFDRKIRLENDVTPVRRYRDIVEALSDAIETRISLGQSILKYYSMSKEVSPDIQAPLRRYAKPY